MNLDYLKYRLKYRYARQLNLTTPVDVSLELSSVCNMSCSYCYHADQKNLPFKKGVMNKHTAIEIITQAANLGVHSLKFNWKGESTLNPAFEEITDFAKRYSIGSTFIDRLTNSNFKFPTHNESIFRGLSHQTKVKISFDSFDPLVFETQRQGGRHALTLDNINKFYNYPERIKSETQIVIQAVRTKKNKDEDIASEVRKRWPEAQVSIRDMVSGRVEKELDEYESKRRDYSQRKPCMQAFARIIFNWNGMAYPCCPDIKEELILGDIYNNSLSEIFNGYRAYKLRQDLKSKKAFESDPCKNCSSFETFKGYRPGFDS